MAGKPIRRDKAAFLNFPGVGLGWLSDVMRKCGTSYHLYSFHAYFFPQLNLVSPSSFSQVQFSYFR